MHYPLLIILLLPCVGNAQYKVTGLGTYRIGVSTPDSLNLAVFEEQPVLVKGTVALPCTHIRLFKATRAAVADLVITNLFLYFYDNRLFKISCDYSTELQRAFRQKHSQGIVKPVSRFSCCIQQTDKVMLLWGEAWLNGDTSALAVHAKGYTVDCQVEDTLKLLITSQQMLALASDCDLPNAYTCMQDFLIKSMTP